MKCYYHHDVDAIAICKNCNRGLCAQCAAEVGKSIACKSTCVAEVEALDSALQRSMKSFETNRRVYAQFAFGMLLVGLGFIVTSFFLRLTAGLTIFVGIIFLLGAPYMYSASRRYK